MIGRTDILRCGATSETGRQYLRELSGFIPYQWYQAITSLTGQSDGRKNWDLISWQYLPGTAHCTVNYLARLGEKLTAKQIDWQEHCQCQSVSQSVSQLVARWKLPAWWPPFTLFSLQLIIKTSNSKLTLINIADTSNHTTPHHTMKSRWTSKNPWWWFQTKWLGKNFDILITRLISSLWHFFRLILQN